MPSSVSPSYRRHQPHLLSFMGNDRYRSVRWSVVAIFAALILFIGTSERSALRNEKENRHLTPAGTVASDKPSSAGSGPEAAISLVSSIKDTPGTSAIAPVGEQIRGLDEERSGEGMLNPEIVASVFKRHCNWDPPSKMLEELAQSNYSVPALVEASVEHCPKSALPFASIDIWYHQADVRLTGGSTEEQARALDKHCNDPKREEACIIFVQTELMRSTGLGASLIMRVVQQPFIVVSAGNDDECVPYRVVPRADEEQSTPSDVDDLIRSPLLIRWYAKNMCLHPAHTGGKLVPLPLGPKWQWHSHNYDGEDKVPIKKHIVDAGATDPRLLFLEQKEKAVYIAMDAGSTDGPYYHPNQGLRHSIVEQVKRKGWPTSAGDAKGGMFALQVGSVSHEDYMKALAKSAFALSPPGRGLDTHRTWEALSLGAIPIVMRNSLDPVYRHLPVMVIGDVSEFTPDNVEAFYRELQGRKDSLDWHRVTAFYWLQFMVRDSRRKGQVIAKALAGVFEDDA